MKRLVLAEAMDRTHVETTRELPHAPELVAFVASFGMEPLVSRSLATLVYELEACGFFVVVVRASDDTQPLVWREEYPNKAIVIRRPNVGYDFGTWATGLTLYPQLLDAPMVLLVNDSLVGPFEPLQGMLDDFRQKDCDVWGATNTTQGKPHLQSYMLGFKDGVLLDAPMKRFWSNIHILDDKTQIIQQYEIGLSRLLFSEGYVTASWFESELIADAGQNPSVMGWRALLDRGFPFVKRQLLTIPNIAYDSDEVPASVWSKYEQDPYEWF